MTVLLLSAVLDVHAVDSTKYFKQEQERVSIMCKLLEDMRNEAAREAALDSAKETAIRMIQKGKMPLEEIADYVPALSLDELKQLEAMVMQMA